MAALGELAVRSEVPLKRGGFVTTNTGHVQGYLAHKKLRPRGTIQ